MLEGRSVIPSRSFHRLAPLVRHQPVALVKPGSLLPHCPNFRGLLLMDIMLSWAESVPPDRPNFRNHFSDHLAHRS